MNKFGLKIIPYSEEGWLFSNGKIVAFKWIVTLGSVYFLEVALFYIFGWGVKAFLLTFLISHLWEVLKGVYGPGFSIRSAIIYVYGMVLAGLDWQIFRSFGILD
jgi:uncharacterized integral membrane protein